MYTIDRYVGARVRQKRRSMGLSLEEVASSIGVTAETLAQYEEGTTHIPTGPMLALSRLFNVEPFYFFETLMNQLERLPPPSFRVLH
ncbi:MAG: transcriptional regulator [Microvirga sp.]|nr:transcriptional regulator [Microvirga sp.]